MPTCPQCNHTFTGTPPTQQVDHETFLGLADSVLAYSRSPGAQVIMCHDDPRTLRIGFQTVNESRTWYISLSKIKSELVGPGDSRLTIYRSYLRHTDSRAMLAAMWSEGREPTEEYASPTVTT